MPCSFIAGYSNHDRTNFYETVYFDFVAIINEEKSLNSDEWTCTNHIMIPKTVLHSFSKLTLKRSKEDEEVNIKYLSYLQILVKIWILTSLLLFRLIFQIYQNQ